MEKRLNFKKLIILLLVLIVIVQTLSAIVMATHINLFGLPTHIWENIHGGFGVALVSLIVIHIFTKRKTLLNYCKIHTKLKQNIEPLVALLLVIIYFIILCFTT